MTERTYDSFEIVRYLGPTPKYKMRFRVHNHAHDSEYTVSLLREPHDLVKWECGCPHWTTRCQFWGRNCKHIRFVVDRLHVIARQKELDATAAIRTLEQYGRDAYSQPISKGTAIGYGVFARAMHDMPDASCEDCAMTMVDAAIEMLTQWNCHLGAEILNVIYHEKGRVTRKGRRVYITLPEHWRML